MKLSKNFSLVEFTKSQIAERKGLYNYPTPAHQISLRSLCTNVLQPVRDHFGRVVSVSSGYRSEELCLAIGSKITSQHAKGHAADFEIFGLSNKELADWIHENLEYDQLILEYWKEEDKDHSPVGGYTDFRYGTIGLNCANNIKVKPKVGDIYIFPNWLDHSVYPFRSKYKKPDIKGERRTFSLNIVYKQ